MLSSNPALLAPVLTKAILDNDAKQVDALLQAGASLDMSFSKDGKNLLQIAVENKGEEIVRLLLKYNSNLANSINEISLQTAVKNNDIVMTRTLLNSGIKPTTRVVDSKTGDTVLHVAINSNNPEMVELLLEHGADYNRGTNKDGWLSSRSAYSKNINTLMPFIHAARKPGARPLNKGVLLDAINQNDTTTVNILLNPNVIAMDTPLAYKSKVSAYSMALNNKNIDIIKLLLAAGIPLDIKDNNNRTPIELAIHLNNEEALALFTAHITKTSHSSTETSLEKKKDPSDQLVELTTIEKAIRDKDIEKLHYEWLDRNEGKDINFDRALSLLPFSEIVALSKKISTLPNIVNSLKKKLSTFTEAEHTAAFAQLVQDITIKPPANISAFSKDALQRLAIIPQFDERLFKHILTLPAQERMDMLAPIHQSFATDPFHIIFSTQNGRWLANQFISKATKEVNRLLKTDKIIPSPAVYERLGIDPKTGRPKQKSLPVNNTEKPFISQPAIENTSLSTTTQTFSPLFQDLQTKPFPKIELQLLARTPEFKERLLNHISVSIPKDQWLHILLSGTFRTIFSTQLKGLFVTDPSKKILSQMVSAKGYDHILQMLKTKPFSKSKLEFLAKVPNFKENLFDHFCLLPEQERLNILAPSQYVSDNVFYIIWRTQRGPLKTHNNFGTALKVKEEVDTLFKKGLIVTKTICPRSVKIPSSTHALKSKQKTIEPPFVMQPVDLQEKAQLIVDNLSTSTQLTSSHSISTPMSELKSDNTIQAIPLEVVQQPGELEDELTTSSEAASEQIVTASLRSDEQVLFDLDDFDTEKKDSPPPMIVDLDSQLSALSLGFDNESSSSLKNLFDNLFVVESEATTETSLYPMLAKNTTQIDILHYDNLATRAKALADASPRPHSLFSTVGPSKPLTSPRRDEMKQSESSCSFFTTETVKKPETISQSMSTPVREIEKPKPFVSSSPSKNAAVLHHPRRFTVTTS